MRDIADALGIHSSTVSLALKDDPRITKQTKEKVLAEAKRQQYTANPLVSALMSHRAMRTPPPYRMEFAFVCATESKEEWLATSTAYHNMLRGATDRAIELGYKLNLYPRQNSKLSTQRFSNILKARNIHGIIIAPMHNSDTRISINWDQFSVIELGYTLQEPVFHRVVHDYFHSMITVMKEVKARGFKRIGLILNENVDTKVHHLWKAAYIEEQSRSPEADRITPLIHAKIDAELFHTWFIEKKPDVVVCIDFNGTMKLAQSIGLEVPRDVSVVSLGCYTPTDPSAGIYQDYELMGSSAVDQLISLVLRNDRNIPKRNLSIQVGGIWVDGPSLGDKRTS